MQGFFCCYYLSSHFILPARLVFVFFLSLASNHLIKGVSTSNTGMEQETKIIAGCISGKRQAQNELYSFFSGRFYGICLRYAGNRTEAQDILQEGFIKIFSRIGTFNSQGSFEGWMKRIIVNTALNYLRDHAREKLFISLNDEADTIPAEFAQPDIPEPIPAETMLNLVQGLPEGYRMVFNLYIFEEHTHKQIAELLEISENTSKTQLMRARLLLQKRIAEFSSKTVVKI
jgi:RNA polymerase sigma factor (sigma-70 family)